jgi:1-aminocyclopropane-1-carboxylate deaminase/D-cysteine desulfhydrase-like pyridoxal-dependent ACC family enzyme
MELDYHNTPIIQIGNELTEQKDVHLFVKREDLNHPTVSGNKWWKLKYNLAEAVNLGHDTILTFGGAYSNHIYSTAAAAKGFGLKSIGIIRGEETHPLNRTLSFARSQGMTLHYVSRDAYRTKTQTYFIKSLENDFGKFFLIPEGGTNEYAIRGCKEFGLSLLSYDFDHLVLPVGTAGTITGLIAGMQGQRSIIGIPVFRNSEFLYDEIRKLLHLGSEVDPGNWTLLTQYHHGGYAKTTPSLLAFIDSMKSQHGLLLDHVYTGKMMQAVFEEIKTGRFARGSRVLAIHTGGLQGAL